MHEVTPSVVPIAVRIVINVWIIIPQMFFFSIVFEFLSLIEHRDTKARRDIYDFTIYEVQL